jgi:hypothetical protein
MKKSKRKLHQERLSHSSRTVGREIDPGKKAKEDKGQNEIPKVKTGLIASLGTLVSTIMVSA